MARARGANAIMAAAFETTYGTPSVQRLPQAAVRLVEPREEQALISSDLLGYGRAATAALEGRHQQRR